MARAEALASCWLSGLSQPQRWHRCDQVGCDADGTIRLWQAQSGQLIQTLVGHSSAVNALTYSPDGRTLASASRDRSVRLWAHQSAQLLISGDDESNLYGWVLTLQPGVADQPADCNQPDYVLTAVPPNGIHTLAFSPEGRLLAAGGAEPIIQLWQMPDQRPIYTLKAHTSSIYGLAFSLDGKTLASSSGDQTIRLWDPSTGELRQTLCGHTGVVRSIVFHPNGRWLISSSGDETMKIWALPTGVCIHTLRPAGLYDSMNITNANGITAAQRATLKALGAVEH